MMVGRWWQRGDLAWQAGTQGVKEGWKGAADQVLDKRFVVSSKVGHWDHDVLLR
jgi:hypothetical protein